MQKSVHILLSQWFHLGLYELLLEISDFSNLMTFIYFCHRQVDYTGVLCRAENMYGKAFTVI